MEEFKKFPKRISRKNVYSSEWLDLNLDTVLFPSGKTVDEYHVIDFKADSVVVVMLNIKDEVCFIRSPRYVTQTLELELPAGFIQPQETILEASAREVLEETGLILSDFNHVYTYNPANTVSNQKSHIVIGRCSELQNGDVIFDKDEVQEVLWLDKNTIIKLIKNKEIKDGFALVSLLYYLHFHSL